MLDRLAYWGQKLNLAILFLWGTIALAVPRSMHLPLIVIAVTGCFKHRFSNIRLLVRPEWILLGALCFWALISTQWSIDRAFAFKEWGKITPVFIAAGSVVLYFHALTREQVQHHVQFFLGGLAFSGSIMVVDRLLGYPLIDTMHKLPAVTYSRFITLACLGIWGGLLISSRSRLRLPLALVFTTAITLFFWAYDFDAGPIALIIALAVMMLTLILPKMTSCLLRFGMVLAPLLVVMGFGYLVTQEHWQKIAAFDMNYTHQQRLEMIDWASKKILERPVLGYGLSQTRVLSVEDKITGYSFVNGRVVTNAVWENGTWHLHNGLLQIFLELGLVGFLLVTSVIWVLLARLYHLGLHRYELGVMHGYATTLLFIFSVGFGVWQTWWLSTIIMLTVLYAFKVNHETQVSSNNI